MADSRRCQPRPALRSTTFDGPAPFWAPAGPMHRTIVVRKQAAGSGTLCRLAPVGSDGLRQNGVWENMCVGHPWAPFDPGIASVAHRAPHDNEACTNLSEVPALEVQACRPLARHRRASLPTRAREVTLLAPMPLEEP